MVSHYICTLISREPELINKLCFERTWDKNITDLHLFFLRSRKLLNLKCILTLKTTFEKQTMLFSPKLPAFSLIPKTSPSLP